MCGIVGYSGPKRRSLPQLLVRHLAALEYRGYDSAGVVSVAPSGFLTVKVLGSTSQLADRLRTAATPESGLAMAHTRWATHGAVTKDNAHPIVSAGGSLAIVMNGIVENDLPLRQAFAARGAQFSTDCDADTVVGGIEMELGSATESGRGAPSKAAVADAVAKIFAQIDGRLAISVTHRAHPDALFLARRGSPLFLGRAGKASWIASDPAAMPDAVGSTAMLTEDEVVVVTSGKVTAGSVNPKRTYPAATPNARPDKGSHATFLEKEILEQAATTAQAVEMALELASFPAVGTWQRILLLGCGSAFHACLVAKRGFEKWARIPADAVLANELLTSDPVIDESTLVIAVSQSGETADTVAAAELAASRGATVIAVTNVTSSSLARMARHTCELGCGREVSVASTKAYTAMLIRLTIMAAELAVRQRTVSAAAFRAFADSARRLGGAVGTALESRSAVRAAATHWRDRPAFLFMGRGQDFPTCLEGALKLKELSYRHADGVAAGELKHGTLALVDPGYPVVAVVLDQRSRSKMLTAMREAQTRGAYVLAIVGVGDDEAKSIAQASIEVPYLGDDWTPVLASLPLQWLALHVAQDLGRDIDRPRNLAKSVTVL